MKYFILIIAISAAAIFAFILFKRKSNNILYSSSIFILFAFADIIIPSIIWTVFGQQFNPPWLNPLSFTQIANGLTFYVVYYFIFIFTLVAGEKNIVYIPQIRSSRKFERKLLLIILIVFFINSNRIMSEIISSDGLLN